VTVAESASQTKRRSVCVIRTTVVEHFNWYTERHAGLSALAQLLAISVMKNCSLVWLPIKQRIESSSDSAGPSGQQTGTFNLHPHTL